MERAFKGLIIKSLRVLGPSGPYKPLLVVAESDLVQEHLGSSDKNVGRGAQEAAPRQHSYPRTQLEVSLLKIHAWPVFNSI